MKSNIGVDYLEESVNLTEKACITSKPLLINNEWNTTNG